MLSSALLNQETGVRGYVIGREPDLLDPYLQGRREEAAAMSALAGLLDDPRLDLGGTWRRSGRAPAAGSGSTRNRRSPPSAPAGRRPATPRTASACSTTCAWRVAALQADLDSAATASRDDLQSAAATLQWFFGLVAAGLLALLVVLALGVRRVVTRPISALAAEVRRVADGDFESQVRATGPREVVELGGDVDAMRRQIVAELAALRAAGERLDQQAQDLERSNAELEQFAYVASHDLQEPLRKVASFSQLLERRYKGQLDERADQYIAFAVDGAKRMQVLINDLLAFSRVGRLTREHAEVDAGELVDQALANLSLVIEETGAEVTVDDGLPVVSGDVSLLTAVFQNLVSNAVKFRGEQPPRVHVGVRDAGEEWEFSVADNGIGIEPEYADRIFVIFQRLHAKDAYPGTGIGLALCRKIVEYHGGRIWLDADVTSGTTFRFTLPKLTTRGAGDHRMTETADPTAALPTAIDVLLVEDDPGDVLMTREAFEEHKLRNTLHVVTDGVEAVSFLRREGDYADAPRPGLILLDLNLPRKDGREVLRRDQGGRGPAHHPGRRAHHLRGRGGRAAQLRPARQRVRHQAGGLRAVHPGGPADRRLLRHRGEAAALSRSADHPGAGRPGRAVRMVRAKRRGSVAGWTGAGWPTAPEPVRSPPGRPWATTRRSRSGPGPASRSRSRTGAPSGRRARHRRAPDPRRRSDRPSSRRRSRCRAAPRAACRGPTRSR